MSIQSRIFVGRHIKLQAVLFAVIGVCLGVFIYGLLLYPDAPYKLCADGYYCGKTGISYDYEIFNKWKSWEKTLFVCWPFGLVASYVLRKLRQ